MNSIKKILLSILLSTAIAAGAITSIAVAAPQDTNTSDEVIYETEASESETQESETEIDLLEIFDTDNLSTTDVKIYSRAGLVMDADTGEVLYYKNPDTAHYPASITKLMTAYIAMKMCDPEELVTISQSALDGITWESSQLGLCAGQVITMREALYSLMVVSANDVALAIGEHISGSDTAFVELMNYYAKRLGCSQTHFMNPHGLHDDDHYMTVYDASLIAKACLSFPDFYDYCSANLYQFTSEILRTPEEIEALKKENKGEIPDFIIYSHHKMVNNAYPYKHIIGGKTGYTEEARNCLSTYASNGKHTLICTVFDCPGGGQNYLYKDTEALFDYCFKNYKKLSAPEHKRVNLTEHPVPYIMNLNSAYIAKQTLVNIEQLASLDPETTLGNQKPDNYCLNNYLLYDKLRSISLTREEEEIQLTFTEKAVQLVDITENEHKSNDEIIVGILIIALIVIVVLLLLTWFIKLSRRKYKRLHYKSMKRKRLKAEKAASQSDDDWDQIE